jgi:spore maturation protein SpmA
MSPDAMKELRRNSETATSGVEAEAAMQAAHAHAVSLLPTAIDLLRAVFGSKGTAVKPRHEVSVWQCNTPAA